MVLTVLWAVVLSEYATVLANHLHAAHFLTPNGVSAVSSSGAVIKGTFAFAGWNSALTVTNEIKDPVRTLRVAGVTSLAAVSVTFLGMNATHLVVIPRNDIAESGELIGAVFFERVYCHCVGRYFLTLATALCTDGNMYVMLFSIASVRRCSARPFCRFYWSRRPTGHATRCSSSSPSAACILLV